MKSTHQIKRRKMPEAVPELPAMPSLLQRIYAARHIREAAELDYSLNRLLPFDVLKDINAATALLEEALIEQQRLLVIGDFDADGATSTALAMEGLRAMGFMSVDYLVPDRFKFGYGLTPEIVDVAAREKKPDLILTVDNGISSIQGVAQAKAKGIKVLVTDHHLAGDTLPEADAIVNPNQPGDDFASKALPGVGVMFYLLMAFRARLRASGWFAREGIVEPNLADYLDLVALGTVADVVPLDRNNRILVAQGLARMRAGCARPGIQALIEVAGRKMPELTAGDIGFVIAPRLNAAGRLDDMSLGIDCLLCDNLAQARERAGKLDSLNRERRTIEAEMKQQAFSILDTMRLDGEGDSLPVGLCLFDESWHEGVVGILASRIKDRLHRPVIAFAQSSEGQIKGSARSVKGVHVRDALDVVAARHPDLLTRFGGHAMAAGLSLPRGNFEAFAAAFDEEVRRHLSVDDLHGVILSDGELAEAELCLETAGLLRQAGPWGQGFEEPLFDGVFQVFNRRVVADKHLKLVLQLPGSQRMFDAIAFNTRDDGWPEHTHEARLAYRLEVNDFGGQRNVQLNVLFIEPLAPGS